MITPRSFAPQGFVDVDKEDYKDPSDQYFIKKQATQLRVIQDQWVDGYKVSFYNEPPSIMPLNTDDSHKAAEPRQHSG